MSNYLLVHGGNVSADTWNNLSCGFYIYTRDGKLWGRVWDLIVQPLTARGHRVYCIDLKDENQCNLTGHIEQICDLIANHNLNDVILVGHSYGGMVITGAAAKTTGRISGLIYVDAALPEPGQSLFDILEAGGRDPRSVKGLESALAYIEKIRFDPDEIRKLPKTYILCTGSMFRCLTDPARQKVNAGGKEWTYREMDSSHLPMVEKPGELAKLLLEAGEKK